MQHIMRMLVSACSHVHKNGISHRNLKPECILVDSKSNKLKIIDFGIFQGDNAEKAYNPPCDMWSLGTIMYQLICGKLLLGEKADFEEPCFSKISKDGNNFMQSLLE